MTDLETDQTVSQSFVLPYVKHRFRWVINGISDLCAKILAEKHALSPVYEAAGNKWQLSVMSDVVPLPQKDGKEVPFSEATDCNIYLRRVKPYGPDLVKTRYAVSICSADGKLIADYNNSPHLTYYTYSADKFWGWLTARSFASLRNSLDGLIIEFTLYVYDESKILEEHAKIKPIKADDFTALTIQQFRAMVNNKNSFSDLVIYTKPDASGLSLDSKEDSIIHAHCSILAARSEPFKAMLSSGMMEKQERSIDYKHYSHDAVLRLLDVLYTGEVLWRKPPSLDVLKDLLELSNLHFLPLIKQASVKCMAADINADNIKMIMSLAKEHALDTIVSLCHRWAQNHAEKAVELLFNPAPSIFGPAPFPPYLLAPRQEKEEKKSLKRKLTAEDLSKLEKRFKGKSHAVCVLPELRRRCQERRIKVPRKLHKQALIDRLVEADRN